MKKSNPFYTPLARGSVVPALFLFPLLLFVLSLLCSCAENQSVSDGSAISTVSERDDGEKEVLRGRALYWKGRTEEALEIFRGLYQSSPGDLSFCTAYVRSLLYSGDPAEALRITKSILQKEQEVNVDILKLAAESAILLEDFEEAEAFLEEALRLSSEDTRLLLLLARCRRAEGRYDEALALLESASYLAERSMEIYLELAQVYGEYDMREESRQAIEKALNLLGEGHPLAHALSEALDK